MRISFEIQDEVIEVIFVSATLVWLQVPSPLILCKILFGSAHTPFHFFSGIRYPECIGVSHLSAGMGCHFILGHHFPHFFRKVIWIPSSPGEKQQKLQEFIDLIDPESLGAWRKSQFLSVGYGYGESVVFKSWVDSNLWRCWLSM